MQPKTKKLRTASIIGFFIALTGPLSAMAVSPGDVSKQAMDLAAANNFTQALALISSQDIETQNSYEVKFTQARILAWDNQYDAAAQAYESLLADFPGNPDIQNGYGYLEYYRGNYDRAEILLSEVLAKYPGYEDAQIGLKRVRDARADAKRKEKRWRLDVNGGTSSFNTDMAGWNYQSARVEHIPGNIALHTDVTRYERFDQIDTQITVGARSNTNNSWDWQIAAGTTPSADFRPKLTGAARIGKSVDVNGTIIHGSLGYQIDDYTTAGTIHQLSPQVVAYLDDDVVLSGRLMHVMQNGEDDQTGFMLSGSAPVVDRLSARIGYANAPEAINGRVINTESVFGGLSYQLTDSLDIHATYSRDDRENTYVRDAVNVGITTRY